MRERDLLEEVIAHLGGEGVLSQIGAREFFSNGGQVSFRLGRHNPAGVRSVVITALPLGYYTVECFGTVPAGTLQAPLINSARNVISENLATELGRLTGIEDIHHRHY